MSNFETTQHTRRRKLLLKVNSIVFARIYRLVWKNGSKKKKVTARNYIKYSIGARGRRIKVRAVGAGAKNKTSLLCPVVLFSPGTRTSWCKAVATVASPRPTTIEQSRDWGDPLSPPPSLFAFLHFSSGLESREDYPPPPPRRLSFDFLPWNSSSSLLLRFSFFIA